MSHAPDSSTCHNCHAPLAGAFCAACGQKAQALNPSLHVLAHDVTHEMLHVDGPSSSRFGACPHVARLSQSRALQRPTHAVDFTPPPVSHFQPAAIRGRRLHGVRGCDPGCRSGIDVRAAAAGVFRTKRSSRRRYSGPRPHGSPARCSFWFPSLAASSRWRRDARHFHYPLHLYFALHVHAAWFAAAAPQCPVSGAPLATGRSRDHIRALSSGRAAGNANAELRAGTTKLVIAATASWSSVSTWME